MMLHTRPCSPIRKAQVMHSLVVGGIFPVSLWFGIWTRVVVCQTWPVLDIIMGDMPQPECPRLLHASRHNGCG